MFGWDNFQDQTRAALEGVSLFNTARGTDLVTGRTAQPCSLITAAAEAGPRCIGV